MKNAFQFHNLLGTIYRKGNILFVPPDNLIIPVGNRINIFLLKSGKSETLTFESSLNITTLDVSPSKSLLIAINEEGESYFYSLTSYCLIQKYCFLSPIKQIKFSHDERCFAITKENFVQIYNTPNCTAKQFNPLSIVKTYKRSYEEITCVDWADNNNYLVCGSIDSVVRFFATRFYKNFGGSLSLTGHSAPVIAIFFFKHSLNVISISTNGKLCVWECDTDIDKLIIDEDKESSMGMFNNSINSQQLDMKESFSDEEEILMEQSNSNVDILGMVPQISVPLLKYRRAHRYHFEKPSSLNHNSGLFAITCADYNKTHRILVTGTNLGYFYVHEMPAFNHIQSLSLSDHSISTITLNASAQWIACGTAHLGQLAVWEWATQNFILKQQSHFNDTLKVAYSPDGTYLATGCFDGKVKLWNVDAGICIVTFKEHTGAITDLNFPRSKANVLLTSSVDGTVRAYDLVRYRNFRTFNPEVEMTPISAIAVDPMAEFVFGASDTSFEIFLWSMKTGKLLEVLSGHTGPVSAIQFDAFSDVLVSASWDATLKIWDVFGSKTCKETIILTSDALALAIHPSGTIVAVSTLNGHLSLWDISDSILLSSVDGSNQDLEGGRAMGDKITSKNSARNRCFTALAFSPDGETLLAAGDSKFACLYGVTLSSNIFHSPDQSTTHKNVENDAQNLRSDDARTTSTRPKVTSFELVKKFAITHNKSLDRMEDDATLNRRKMTEFGNMAMQKYQSASDNVLDDVAELEQSETLKLPGVKKIGLDASSRFFKPEIRVTSVQFSPSGRSFALATTEGALIYSLDSARLTKRPLFDPFELDFKLTPSVVHELCDKGSFQEALMAALRMNDKQLIRHVIENIPPSHSDYIISTLHPKYVLPLLAFVGTEIESSPQIQFYLTLAERLLRFHGALAARRGALSTDAFQLKMIPLLNLLQKSIRQKYDALKQTCNENKYYLEFATYLQNMPKRPIIKQNDALEKGISMES